MPSGLKKHAETAEVRRTRAGSQAISHLLLEGENDLLERAWLLRKMEEEWS
jgi:hypothetical protein